MTLRSFALWQHATFVFVGVLLSGCWVAPGPQMEILPPDRPETFEFFMQPGSGAGDLADELASDSGFGLIVPGSASHVASLETQSGLIRIVTMQSREEGGLHCVGWSDPNGGSTSCSEEPLRGDLDRGRGWGSDGMWNHTYFLGPEGTEKVIVTVEDGTLYTIHTHEGFGIMTWATMRGEITKLVAFDGDGEELQVSEG